MLASDDVTLSPALDHNRDGTKSKNIRISAPFANSAVILERCFAVAFTRRLAAIQSECPLIELRGLILMGLLTRASRLVAHHTRCVQSPFWSSDQFIEAYNAMKSSSRPGGRGVYRVGRSVLSGWSRRLRNSASETIGKVKQSVPELIDRAYELRETTGLDQGPSSEPFLTYCVAIPARPRSGRAFSGSRKRSIVRPHIHIRRDNDLNDGYGGNSKNWKNNNGENGNRNANNGNGYDNRDGNGNGNRGRNGDGGNGNGGNANDDPPSDDYTFQAVACADAADAGNVTTKMVFNSVVDSARTASPVFGQLWSEAGLYCHKWPVRAIERFTGPFKKTPSNKIIVVGNEADPSTPFVSAKNVADALGDSAILIEQDDFGHVSLAMHSDCTQGALTDYFLNDSLPTADRFCGTNQTLFPGRGITKNTLSILAAAEAPDSGALQADLDKAPAYSQTLTAAVVVLACTVALLVIWLIGTYLLARKTKAAAPVTYVTPEALEKAVQGRGVHFAK
ncbi:hypothetical protein FRC12_003174 [Ceratobasidium sp. 428]|nr:hypothetical protein FRC12_003174 [Ceratobasidium sp. 428]